MAKGYVVIDTEVHDPEAYADVLANMPSAIEANGGRFVVRTSDAEPIEGGWTPKRLVILEFESLDAARGFLNSAEYMALSDVRQRAANFNSRIVIAEGSDS